MPDGLYRSRRDRMIGGVAGGIAESLHVDPTIVRVGWVLFALLTNGLLVLVYFVLLFVVPEAPDDAPVVPKAASNSGPRSTAATTDRRSGTLVVGAILVLVGGFFLVRRFLPSVDLAAGWPFIAVGLGLVLVLAALRPGKR